MCQIYKGPSKIRIVGILLILSVFNFNTFWIFSNYIKYNFLTSVCFGDFVDHSLKKGFCSAEFSVRLGPKPVTIIGLPKVPFLELYIALWVIIFLSTFTNGRMSYLTSQYYVIGVNYFFVDQWILYWKDESKVLTPRSRTTIAISWDVFFWKKIYLLKYWLNLHLLRG